MDKCNIVASSEYDLTCTVHDRTALECANAHIQELELQLKDARTNDPKNQYRKIWDLFILKCSIDTFGEKAVITEGKQHRVFLGSVEKYQKIFDLAVAEYFGSQEKAEGVFHD